MKKILIATIAGLIAAPAAAQSSDSATGVAQAQVIAPIDIMNVDPTRVLNFGAFTVGATGGDVVVQVDGSSSTTGDVDLSSITPTTSDEFLVTGEAGQTFLITVTGTTVASGTDTMTFVPIFSSGDTGATTVERLDGTGNLTFQIGGTLTATANQPVGIYTGTYNVDVNYN